MKTGKSLPYLFLIPLILLCATSALADKKIEEEFRKEISMEPGGTLYLENGIGEIEVTGWDEHKAQIIAVKKIRKYGDREEAQEVMDKTEIEIKKSGGELRIKTHFPKSHDLSGDSFFRFFNLFRLFGMANKNVYISVNYQIKIPRKTDLVIDVGVGEIKAYEIAGRLEAETGVGEIELHKIDGPIDLETGVGEINLSLISGPADVSTGVGEITLGLAHDMGADLDISCGVGEIHLDFPVKVQGKFVSKQVNGTINGGGPRIKVSTGVGEVKINKISTDKE